MKAKYDRIGTNYNSTRKADPFLAECLFRNLKPEVNHLYLDIGCGTGNYTDALQRRGVNLIGIDPSEKMLKKARTKNDKVDWRLGSAERTALETGSIDGIIGTLTTHHWSRLQDGFAELHRVLKPGGRIVIFTATPKQMTGYWLNHYFPKMLKDSMLQMPSWDRLSTAMMDAGFTISETEKYFIQPDLQDLFLYSGKFNPHLYFDPQVRHGISSFSALANQEEVDAGLEKMKVDIQSGAIDEVMKSYENEGGDYLYVVGVKNI